MTQVKARAFAAPSVGAMPQGRTAQHIAVVEDDAAVLHSLDFMLSGAGYRVSTYASAGEADASAEIATAACLIVDYALPDFDGLTLLARLRRRGISAPAMLVASVPSVRCRQAARGAGVPLMEKPLVGASIGDWVARMTACPRA